MMDALRELIDFALEFPEDADVGSKGETNRLGEKADKELAQLQAIATAAREYFHKTKGLADFAHIEYEDLEAALAALEQETKK